MLEHSRWKHHHMTKDVIVVCSLSWCSKNVLCGLPRFLPAFNVTILCQSYSDNQIRPARVTYIEDFGETGFYSSERWLSISKHCPGGPKASVLWGVQAGLYPVLCVMQLGNETCRDSTLGVDHSELTQISCFMSSGRGLSLGLCL